MCFAITILMPKNTYFLFTRNNKNSNRMNDKCNKKWLQDLMISFLSGVELLGKSYELWVLVLAQLSMS